MTEVHAEISLVFQHNHIVLRSQFSDNLQLTFFQTNPCRIIRVRIYHSGNISLRQETFQFGTQRFTTEIMNVEQLPLNTQNAQLRFLYRETRINEQDLVLSRNSLGTSDKSTERSCHRTGSGQTCPRRNINIDKGFHET